MRMMLRDGWARELGGLVPQAHHCGVDGDALLAAAAAAADDDDDYLPHVALHGQGNAAVAAVLVELVSPLLLVLSGVCVPKP